MRTFTEFLAEVWKHPVTGQPISPEEYLELLKQKGSNVTNNPIGTGVASAGEKEAEEKRQQQRQMSNVTSGKHAPVSDLELNAMAKQMNVSPDSLIAPSLLIAMKGRDPKGGNEHAYPFYRGKDGKVYRYG